MTRAQSAAGHIGRGIRIKGTVRGKEDLVVEGEVDGTITLPEHHLLLELSARTTAELRAKNTTIRGRHTGDVEASDKVELTAEGCMIGNVKAPRLVIREGAKLRGRIEMDVPLPPDLEVPDSTSASRKSDGKKKGRGSTDKEKGNHGE